MRRPNLFEEILGLPSNSSCCNYSNLTISEDENKVYVDAPIPGVKSENVEVTLDQEKRYLVISAKRKLERENVYYHMKGSNCYSYQIPLTAAIDINKPIEASCKEGILMVAMTKTRSPEPIKVQVA